MSENADMGRKKATVRKDVQIVIRVSSELHAKLEEAAFRRELTVAAMGRMCWMEHIDSYIPAKPFELTTATEKKTEPEPVAVPASGPELTRAEKMAKIRERIGKKRG